LHLTIPTSLQVLPVHTVWLAILVQSRRSKLNLQVLVLRTRTPYLYTMDGSWGPRVLDSTTPAPGSWIFADCSEIATSKYTQRLQGTPPFYKHFIEGLPSSNESHETAEPQQDDYPSGARMTCISESNVQIPRQVAAILAETSLDLLASLPLYPSAACDISICSNYKIECFAHRQLIVPAPPFHSHTMHFKVV
jgi:hypothetical protein